jgi:pentose-5-phosphate-3-epimerase
MVDIIPAVLVKKFQEIEGVLERIKNISPLVQIDIVDEKILEGQEAMPLWEEFDFEFDLMVPHPEHAVPQVLVLGASRVIVHAQAKNARQALEMLQETRVGDYAVLCGVALRAHDTPETLDAFDGLYDYVQVMGIDVEGHQGEPPDPHHRELSLIRALRARYPDLTIQVDGAVAAHPKELVEAGATRLVVGSAIVHADNPKVAFKAVYTKANG